MCFGVKEKRLFHMIISWYSFSFALLTTFISSSRYCTFSTPWKFLHSWIFAWLVFFHQFLIFSWLHRSRVWGFWGLQMRSENWKHENKFNFFNLFNGQFNGCSHLEPLSIYKRWHKSHSMGETSHQHTREHLNRTDKSPRESAKVSGFS